VVDQGLGILFSLIVVAVAFSILGIWVFFGAQRVRNANRPLFPAQTRKVGMVLIVVGLGLLVVHGLQALGGDVEALRLLGIALAFGLIAQGVFMRRQPQKTTAATGRSFRPRA
jgi:hypothetical protein